MYFRLIFKAIKVSEFFFFKGKIPQHLRSYLKYEFVCAGCNASYVRETQLYILTKSYKFFGTWQEMTPVSPSAMKVVSKVLTLLPVPSDSMKREVKKGSNVKYSKAAGTFIDLPLTCFFA